MANQTTFDIIRDTREKDDFAWRFSLSKTINNIIIKKLDTGDYAIDGMIDKLCIERKCSTTEIANNIKEARFYRELDRMAIYPHKYIICEFDFSDILIFPKNSGMSRAVMEKIRMSPNYIIMKMSEIQIKYNIPVIYAGSSENAQIIAGSLMKRVYEQYI